ncbi:MAG: 3D domain-containing protein [Patescibacteria group bacterium]|nr:3D domain-containing protein [Patescibacteria group bacterium]
MRTVISASVAAIVSAMVLNNERSVSTNSIPLPKSSVSMVAQSNPSGTRPERARVLVPTPAGMEKPVKSSSEINSQPVSVEENRQTNSEYPVSRTITVMATGYASEQGAVTFTGTSPRWGEVAVDPRYIPLGTLMLIPEFPGVVFRAEDTGSLVKGWHIDIWFYTREEALQWGVKYIKINLLGRS